MVAKRLTTEVDDPAVMLRAKMQHALTGIPLKRLITAALDKGLPSLDELSLRLRESEATS